MDNNPFVGFLARKGFRLSWGTGSYVKLMSTHKYKVWEDPLHYWITCIQYLPGGIGLEVAKAFHVKGDAFEDDVIAAKLRQKGMLFADGQD
jgi:hypothetical protein